MTPVKINNDSNGNSGFCRGNCNYKCCEENTIKPVWPQVFIECNEIYVEIVSIFSVVFGPLSAITIQPTIAASSRILITSNGSAYPVSFTPSICVPIWETFTSIGALVVLVNEYWNNCNNVIANPQNAA